MVRISFLTGLIRPSPQNVSLMAPLLPKLGEGPGMRAYRAKDCGAEALSQRLLRRRAKSFEEARRLLFLVLAQSRQRLADRIGVCGKYRLDQFVTLIRQFGIESAPVFGTANALNQSLAHK